MKVDVKHNIPRESTYHFRNKQHTTGDVQIEDIDHTDIQTDKRNADRDLQTKKTHWINTPSTITHLGLNRHHNPNQLKKPTKSKHKGDSQYNTIQCNAMQYNTIQYNTTQHNPHPIAPWLVGWLLGWLVAWSVGCLVHCLVSWLVGPLFSRLVGWSVGWSVGQSVALLYFALLCLLACLLCLLTCLLAYLLACNACMLACLRSW